ncbi:MAG: hypothetical protein IT178_11960 [Acidobacteria bacterium]|nr:hypothetical protein [Acidobacteriota bacterium]
MVMTRQGWTIAVTLALAVGAAVSHLATRGDEAPVTIGVRFADVGFRSPRLGGALDAVDIAAIQATAREEIVRAFGDLRVRITDDPRSRYQIRIVPQVLDRRLARETNVAGQSRGMAGFGGYGEVSFIFAAASAVAYAEDWRTRAEIVAAIGRGLGRSAVHELAHQMLPRAPLHASRDRLSYEFYSAARPEQYYGALRWDTAWPLLEQRLGRSSLALAARK